MSRPIISLGARSLAKILPALSDVPGPVYLALADSVTALVRDGRVTAETRLPSERELAGELGLSRATVTAAYDQPRARALLASRTGAGSFVTIPTASGRPAHYSALNRWVPPVPDPAE